MPGLSPNQLRALIDEHGSLDAAIEARPDLASELRAIRQRSESIQLPIAAVPDPEPIDADAMAEYQIELHAVAHERALRRASRTKGDPGRPEEKMSRKTLATILELCLRRAQSGTGQPSLEAISTATRHPGLDFVSRKRITPIADWVAANQRRTERELSRGEIPAQFRPTLSD